MALISAYALAADPSEGALLAARYTARAAFLFFLVVVSTGPALRWWKAPIWQWLSKRRRHLGLAFAGLMLLHLVALAINVGFFRPRPASELVGGGIVYALVALMALTSNDAAQQRMGKWWRRLHWLGVTAVLLTFTQSYVLRLFEPDYFWTGAIFAPLALSALAIRFVEPWRKHLFA